MKTTLTLEDVERLEETYSLVLSETMNFYREEAAYSIREQLFNLLPLILPVIREYVGNPEGLRPPAQASPDQGTDVPPVCEVEPLGEIQRNGDLSFYDESGDELYISKHNQNIVIGAESGASMERAHVRSLIAHLTAWLHTGSFDLKGLPSSPPSSEDTEPAIQCYECGLIHRESAREGTKPTQCPRCLSARFEPFNPQASTTSQKGALG